MPREPVARRRAFAAGISALLHLAAFALLLLWPTGQPVDPPREALTTIAFPSPAPSPTAEPPPAPSSRKESARPPRDAGAQGALAAPVPTLAAALPVAQPSIAPELDLANGSDARLGGGTIGQGRGGAVGTGRGGGGTGGAGKGFDGSPAIKVSGAIRDSDYPRAARKTEAAGQVETQIAVDARGRATDCKVIGSSGSAELDQTTCRLILRRFRFTPARDRLGRPIPSTWYHDQTWRYRRVEAE